jgi:hypothetical protein
MNGWHIENPEDRLGPIFFRGERPLYWVFAAMSEKLLNEERIPGLRFVHVDKLDGHVWTEEELYRLVGHL